MLFYLLILIEKTQKMYKKTLKGTPQYKTVF